ncbi:MAG: electron transfer flavoprotein subunit beta/FixA family protein [Firmicutes bacterium]|nr:electron transfer flavoprotein subunit beta/FixA family protein [Bacillota bacterium]
MQIVVPIKQVPDTMVVRIDPETGTMVREGAPAITNPDDLHAVEAANQLKERYGGSITVLSMGPMQAEESLREALSLGADRAILLSGREFAGADTLATSYALSMAIRRIAEAAPVDLVICGRSALDGETGQVGPGLARRLQLTQLTYVKEILDVDQQARTITVIRETDRQRVTVRGRLPALLTVDHTSFPLHEAPLPEMIRAAKVPLEVWGGADVHADPQLLGLKGSPTVVHKSFAPPQPPGAQWLEGETDTLIEQLMELLAQKGVKIDG